MVKFIDRYEHSIAVEARRRGACGVVCGHVHKPEMRIIEGIQYFNDGDWVESCSALVEHWDGRLELVDWARQRRFESWRRSGRRCRRGWMRPPPDAHPSGERRLGAAGQWRRAHPATGARASARRSGTDVEVVSPEQFRTVPCPTYPEIRLAWSAGPPDRRADRGVATRCDPHRDRGPARHRRAPAMPAPRPALHHLLSHALSRIRERALSRCRSPSAMPRCAGSTGRPGR